MTEQELIIQELRRRLTEAEKQIPQVKIGDVVWFNRNYKGLIRPQMGLVSEIFFTDEMEICIVVKHVGRGKFGKDVFRTMEDAEKHLKEKQYVHT